VSHERELAEVDDDEDEDDEDDLDDGFEGPDLGPDERDMDLLDGSWEERYYAGRLRQRDWSTVLLGLALLALLGMLGSAFAVLLR
jgi:hypothetical protein